MVLAFRTLSSAFCACAAPTLKSAAAATIDANWRLEIFMARLLGRSVEFIRRAVRKSCAGSVHPGAGSLDRLFPARCFGHQELAEILRPEERRVRALAHHAVAYLGAGQHLLECVAQLGHHVFWRAGGGEEAVEPDDLEPLDPGFDDGRHIGKGSVACGARDCQRAD